MGMSMETLAQGGLGFTAAKKPGFSFEKVYGKKKEDKNKAGKKKKIYKKKKKQGKMTEINTLFNYSSNINDTN